MLAISATSTELARALDEHNALAAAERVARVEAERATAEKMTCCVVLMKVGRGQRHLGGLSCSSQATDQVAIDMARQIERIASTSCSWCPT